jgi:hypothetical protein
MAYNQQPPAAQAAPVMGEDAQAPADAPPSGGDQAQTAEIPASMFGGQTPKEGDTFEFKVVAVNAENGSVTVAYSTGEKPGMGGSDGLAESFSKDKMQKGAM